MICTKSMEYCVTYNSINKTISIVKKQKIQNCIFCIIQFLKICFLFCCSFQKTMSNIQSMDGCWLQLKTNQCCLFVVVFFFFFQLVPVFQHRCANFKYFLGHHHHCPVVVVICKILLYFFHLDIIIHFMMLLPLLLTKETSQKLVLYLWILLSELSLLALFFSSYFVVAL